MVDKTNQIVQASINVFVKKGYVGTTTKEIAEKAKVAEVTLYRKFGTKKHLFEYCINSLALDKFNVVINLDNCLNPFDFTKQLLDNRLLVISKNIKVVRMLISESLLGNLPKELRFTNVIFNQVYSSIKEYFEKEDINLDSQAFAKIIGGILLGYAILPNDKSYNTLSKTEKEIYLNNYLDIIFNNNTKIG